MVKRKLSILFVFLLVGKVFGVAGDGLVCTSKISEVLKYVDEGSLVFFDIDGTLTKIPENLVGSNWWAHRKVKSIGVKDGMATWIMVQNNVSMELVEKDGSAVVLLDELMKRGNFVMGFTSRGVALADRTNEQLKPLNVKFSFVGVEDKGNDFLLKHGIIFTNPLSNKGTALDLFLNGNLLGGTPKKIVFVDDKENQLLSVGAICKLKGIAYTGILYSATHEEDKRYEADPEKMFLCEIQLYLLENEKKLISGKEAKEILDNKDKFDGKFGQFLKHLLKK